ncbi:hypothetical protein RFI_30431 [Reticulomyxa filosa]|uniref:SAM domain-containing protein n=1 Tax=Reticulomyxa filosa TaxID=46433 RepID=X6LYH4_RETFI|nr:hypothetical protein RFI_30431 [Reticulomyxa filosa]|eukprot:ETO06963.1 hypothetical protein RFI_30431 [Reticulomyxa filosa]
MYTYICKKKIFFFPPFPCGSFQKMFRPCMVAEDFPLQQFRSQHCAKKPLSLAEWVQSQGWGEKDSASILTALKNEGVQTCTNLLELTESDIKDIAKEGNLNILMRRKLIAAVFDFQDEHEEGDRSQTSAEGMTRQGNEKKRDRHNNEKHQRSITAPVQEGKTDVNDSDQKKKKKKEVKKVIANEMNKDSLSPIQSDGELGSSHHSATNIQQHSLQSPVHSAHPNPSPNSNLSLTLSSISNTGTSKKGSMGDHLNRKKVVIVKVEPRESEIYDQLIQTREFLEDAITTLEQKHSIQSQTDDDLRERKNFFLNTLRRAKKNIR